MFLSKPVASYQPMFAQMHLVRFTMPTTQKNLILKCMSEQTKTVYLT